MGINLCPSFLDPTVHTVLTKYHEELQAGGASSAEVRSAMGERSRELPRPTMDWFARHAFHAMDVGGEDAVGIGGDLDGVTSLPKEIDGIADYPRIADNLQQAGLTTRQVEKVCYLNFMRVFSEVLPETHEA